MCAQFGLCQAEWVVLQKCQELVIQFFPIIDSHCVRFWKNASDLPTTLPFVE